MNEIKHGLRRVAGYFVNHRLLNWMPDKPYRQISYYAELGKLILGQKGGIREQAIG